MKMTRPYLAYAHDLMMAGLSVVAAYYLRVGDNAFGKYGESVLLSVPLFVLVAAVVFQFMGMYRGIWRYASIHDFITITKAASLAVLISVPLIFILGLADQVPRSVPILQWIMLLMMLGGPRLAYRAIKDTAYRDHLLRSQNRKLVRIILLGAGDGAELFIRSVLHDLNTNYRIVGVLDPKGRRIGRYMHGIPVLDTPDNLEQVLNKLDSDNLRPQRLIFTEDLSAVEYKDVDLKKIADDSERLGLTLSRLPNLMEFKDGYTGQEAVLPLRPIKIEDLLGRSQVPLDINAIQNFVSGRRILISGAGGSIGSELTRQIASYGPKHITLLDNCEYNLFTIDNEVRERYPNIPYESVLGDIRDPERVEQIFQDSKPEIVFHAAALKHVPVVELNPSEGILTNVIGTRNIADAAKRHGIFAFVQISTDKAVNPANIMGASKRLGEYYGQSLDLAKGATTRFVTVRFGNVLGSSGSVATLFRRQLEKGGPLTVTHPDIKRYFMTVREAVGLVLQASAYGSKPDANRGQIYVLDMGEAIRIDDIARQMIRLSGRVPDKDIKIEYTGLRPGEKLYEELFDDSETPTETGIPSTQAAIPEPIKTEILIQSFDKLEKAARQGNKDMLVSLISELVPGFRSGGLSPEVQNASDNVTQLPKKRST